MKCLSRKAIYKFLLDSLSDAVFIHELNGPFLEVKRAACERLGYSRAELQQKGFCFFDDRTHQRGWHNHSY